MEEEENREKYEDNDSYNKPESWRFGLSLAAHFHNTLEPWVPMNGE
jgi:hypothetical protein